MNQRIAYKVCRLLEKEITIVEGQA